MSGQARPEPWPALFGCTHPRRGTGSGCGMGPWRAGFLLAVQGSGLLSSVPGPRAGLAESLSQPAAPWGGWEGTGTWVSSSLPGARCGPVSGLERQVCQGRTGLLQSLPPPPCRGLTKAGSIGTSPLPSRRASETVAGDKDVAGSHGLLPRRRPRRLEAVVLAVWGSPSLTQQ